MRFVKPGDVIKYLDKHGQNRELTYKGPGFILGDYFHIGTSFSLTSRWVTEDGSLIQIPDKAWEILGVDYVISRAP